MIFVKLFFIGKCTNKCKEQVSGNINHSKFKENFL